MFKACIDPGHAGGNTDPGACNPNNGLQEADVALSVSTRVQHYLIMAGAEVVMTRTASEDAASDDLGYRCDIANQAQVDAMLSIHCNSAGASAANGVEIWTSPGQTNGDILADCVMKQIESTFPGAVIRSDFSDGDVDKEARFQMLTQTDAPAALLEMGFISNDEEAALLADPDWQSKMAAACARGLTDFAAIMANA